MAEFCDTHGIKRGYVITRDLTDFKVQAIPNSVVATRLLNIPAALACYWLGRSELETANRDPGILVGRCRIWQHLISMSHRPCTLASKRSFKSPKSGSSCRQA
jgi:hypothetical protein